MPRLLVVFALLVSLLAAPVAAGPAFPIALDTASLTATAEWAGCRGVVVSDIESLGGFNAYFGVDWNARPRIVMIGLEQVPPAVRAMIFLHELGHCLQWMEGSILTMGEVERELDADRRAAQLACALHLDGPRMLRELFEWARDSFGYEGDPSHGTLVERIGQGERADWCYPRQQAPFLETA